MHRHSTNCFNFTHQRLENIKPPVKKREAYHDTAVPGLALFVTPNNVRSFYLVKRIHGKSARIFIGKHPGLTLTEARKIAQNHIAEIGKGNDPRAIKRKQQTVPTLWDLFQHWYSTYAVIHKGAHGHKQDLSRFNQQCKPLHRCRLDRLTKYQITEWHQQLGKSRGYGAANNALALIKSLFRLGDEIGYEGVNPCTGVRRFPQKERERFLLPDELEAFYKAVNQESPLIRDVFLMLLLTGQRKRTVCQMCWKDIDMKNKFWHVPGIKQKNGDPLVVVLSEPACGILEERYKNKNERDISVFPSPQKSKQKGISNLDDAWGRIKERMGVHDIVIHDLRRTFASWQAISGTSLLVIGKSLGHRSTSSTEIYARLITDPVRESVDRATKRMLEYRKDETNSETTSQGAISNDEE
ncbi:MAG: site-specific integrase [Planctomycetaceae bacterium]|nr:site-specific integrase [Planctomycetaceae bacterium]